MFPEIDIAGAELEELLEEGQAAMRIGYFEAAEHCFRTLAQRDGKVLHYKRLYIESLISQYKYDAALRTLNRLIKKDAGASPFLDLRARTSMLSGNFKQAEKDLKAMLQVRPDAFHEHKNLGHLYRSYGQLEKAREAYGKGIALNPADGQCFRLLRDLGRAREESALDREVAADLESGKRSHADFYFGLGKLHDDLGDYERAWEYFVRGNALVHQEHLAAHPGVPDVAATGAVLRDAICRYIDTHGTAAREFPINAVLVAGFPRSGTTMFENVLSSDKRFRACGELTFAGHAETALRLTKPDGLELDAGDVAAFGKFYTAGLKHLGLGRSIAVDKGTGLFRLGGLFMLASGSLKMLHPVRDPRDTILSNFKSRFTVGQHFSYSLDGIIRYLGFYREVIRLWHERFPDRVRLLDYDAYVRDPATHNQTLSGWLDGGPKPYVFSFKKRDGAVNTASAAQVGERIRTDSSGRSNAYASFLKEWDDLIDRLC